MSTRREFLPARLQLGQSSQTMPALRHVVDTVYQPNILAVEVAPAVFATPFPWHIEVAVRLTDPAGWLIAYVVPFDNETFVIANVGERAHAIIQRLTGPDHGDVLLELVAAQWPEIYGMLCTDFEQRRPEPTLGSFTRMSGSVYAIVATPSRVHGDGQVDAEAAEKTLRYGLLAAIKFEEFPMSLRGSLEALGGPDRLSRTLASGAAIMSAASSIVGNAEDGFDVDELIDGLKSVFEVSKRVWEITRDWSR